MANYIIHNKKIIAKVGYLTKSEIKKIQNYKALFDYPLVEYNTKEHKDLFEKEKTPVNQQFTKEGILNYLKEKGTKEQQAKYWELYNEPTKKELYTKSGERKTKGHIATIKWFKKEFGFEN